MAKGNNTGKPKRSHSYKPYDASNSSLVKRFTTKVSEILPSPSWISRWLPSSQLNARSDRNDEDEEEEEEEIREQPPVKRIRLQTTLNTHTHHNHVERLSDSPENAEELSPISRVDHRDGAVAGPSGLQIRRSNFISSTPATTQTISLNKVNQGDDGSDSAESTSGCSSLVPQADRNSANTLPIHSIDSHKTFSPGAVRRLSTSKDKFSKLNLSATNSSRPTFDTYVFHNPHNKSMNSSRSSQLDDSSPFYRGRTMFGGASANRESLNSSILSPTSRPRVTNVKPISRQVPERDTIGSSAQRILRALEQISTPVTEARKMPMNESTSRRRKAFEPFDELIIPQMPAILRIKRKKRNENESCTSVNTTKDTIDSSTLINVSGSDGDHAASSSASIVPASNESNSKQSSYTLRKEDSEKDEKFVTSIKGRASEMLENERLPEVNLPNVKLDISSLPVFNIPTANKIVSEKRVSQPDSTVKRTLSTETSSISKSTLSARPSKVQFKFSEPIVENIDHCRISNVKSSFKFSNPLDVESLSNEKQYKNINKIPKDNNDQSSLKEDSNKTLLYMSSGNPNPKLKRKSNHEEKPNVIGTKLSSNSLGSSIADAFKTNSGMNGKNKFTLITSSSDSNKDMDLLKTKTVPKDAAKSNIVESSKSTEFIKSNDNKWSCNKCLVENNNSDKNCLKCGLLKLNKDNSINVSSSKDKQEVSTDLVQCKTCSSSYKASDNKCMSCTTAKATDTSSASTNVSSSTSAADVPLSALFKKSAGSWECSECLVSNKSDVDTCVACSTPKPGAVPKANAQSTSTFKFGIPPSTSNAVTATGFKFGIENFANDSNKTNSKNTSEFGGFKFGSNTSTPSTTTAAANVQDFKFGLLPSTSKESETKVTFTLSKPPEDSKKNEDKEIEIGEAKSLTNKSFTFGNSGEVDKQNEKKDEPNKDGAPVKKVTFSQQLVEEKTISTDTNTPSSFSFVSSTKSYTQSSTTFTFSKAAPLFGNVNTPSSTTETDKPAVSTSSLFKFGSPFTGGTTSVASSTAVSSAPASVTASDSAVSVSSSLVTSSNNDKSNSTFSFLPNNAPKPIFSSTSDTEKKDSAIFGSINANNKTSSFSNSVVASSSGFTFGSCANDSQTNADKDKNKEPTTNSFFGEKRDTTTPSLIPLQPKKEEKPNFFASSSSKSDNKPMFFTSSNTNKNASGIFGSAKTEEWKTKPTFGSESFEPKSSATSSTVTPFGSSTLMANSTERKNEQFTFNATSNQANSNICPFVFKGAETTSDNKSSGGFAFNAHNNNNNNNNQQIPSTNLFGASSQQQPTTNLFGSTSATLFNAGPQQPNNPTAPPSFTFGAQSQPPQAIFGFSAPSQVPSGGTGTMGETFQFGSQNALPHTAPAPSGPPTFDPNIKPNYNFSGGATAPPTFSAQSSGLPSATPAPPKDRKIRKAVRRTLR